MIVIVMGVVGAGKTTVGRLLAAQLGWEFADGDDYHPAANVEKIRRGIALDDDDRRWCLLRRAHMSSANAKTEKMASMTMMSRMPETTARVAESPTALGPCRVWTPW